MHQIPKFYTNDWANEFRTSARDFARNEDKHAGKRLFDGAGYGTERWDKLTALPPESIAKNVLSQVVPPNGSPIKLITPTEEDDPMAVVKQALGEDRFARMMEDPEAFKAELERLEARLKAAGSDEEVETEKDVELAPADEAVEVDATDEAAPAEAFDETVVAAEAVESEDLLNLIEAFGEERWQAWLLDPKTALDALAGTTISDVEDSEPDDEDEGEQAPELDEAQSDEAEDRGDEKLLASLREKNDSITADVEKMANEKRTVDQELKRIQAALDEKEREIQAMAKKVKSLEEKEKQAENQKGRVSERANYRPPNSLPSSKSTRARFSGPRNGSANSRTRLRRTRWLSRKWPTISDVRNILERNSKKTSKKPDSFSASRSTAYIVF